MKTNKEIAEWLKRQPWCGEFASELREQYSAEKVDSILEGNSGFFTIEQLIWSRTNRGLFFWAAANRDFKAWYNKFNYKAWKQKQKR